MDLADTIVELYAKLQSLAGIRLGYVVELDQVDPKARVQFGGETVWLRYLASADPRVNEMVQVAEVGGEQWIVGRIAAELGAPWVRQAAVHETTNMDVTLDLSGVQAGNSGTVGLKLARDTTDGGPAGLTLRSPFVADAPGGTIRDQWDVVTLDAGTNDLVLVGDHWADGESEARRFGDQIRIAHGMHMEIGYSVGLQSPLRRVEISSEAEDDPAMQNLLLLSTGAGSPVTFPLRIIDGELGSSTDMFYVTSIGAVLAKGSITGASILSKGTLASSTSRLGVENTEANGRVYRMVSGIPGVQPDGFTLIDETDNARRLLVLPGGNVRLANAAVTGGDLANAATDGFVVIPQVNGDPTGVPTAFGGNSGGAVVWNRSGARMCVYVDGVGWFESAAFTQIP